MKTRILKIAFCAFVFALVGLPTLVFFGVKEEWTKISGWERRPEVPKLTWQSFSDRTFQNEFTEDFAKRFFLRKAMLKTSFQLRDWWNFGQFHYGFGGVLEGRDNIIYEKAYAKYHLEKERHIDKTKFGEILKLLREVDDYCRSIGADFVFMTFPDKLQTYPDSLPRWLKWFWNYENKNTSGEVAALCREAGVKVYEVAPDLFAKRASWETCVYPPGGAHFNAYGMGLVYEGFLDWYAKNGRLKLKRNPFKGVRPIKEIWSVDDDISLLMNTWRNEHLRTNPHYAPVFAASNVVMNAGSVIAAGDCFREQVQKIFQDSGLFDPKKVERAWRHGKDTVKHLEPYAKDLKLFVLVYQSFNTERLPDENQVKEIRNILDCIREVRAGAKPRGI